MKSAPLQIKLTEDEICEFLSENLAREKNMGRFQSRVKIFGTPGVDLRAVVLLKEDMEIYDQEFYKIDMDSIDREGRDVPNSHQ